MRPRISWTIDCIFLQCYNNSGNPNPIGSDWSLWSNANNPDDSYPWAWNFDFPKGAGYYEFYSIGNKTGSADESAPLIADAICRFNRIPEISNEVPSNGSTNIQITPQLNITVNELDGETMTITWYSNTSGSWQIFGTNTSVGNGTYYQTNDNFSSPGTTYWWNVSVYDGVHTNTSEIFHFTTSYNPAISNPWPNNESVAQYTTPICNVTVSDPDGGTVVVRFYENTTGPWILQQTNTSVDVTNPASVVWDNYSNASEDFMIYWWKVNVSDGKGCYAEEIYWFRTISTSIQINPNIWNQGTLQIGTSNETSGFYFNLTNQGDAALDIQIKATNATNTTTGLSWQLNESADLDNYSLLYNKSTSGSWANINLTYDTFISNFALGFWQTFDLKLILATLSSRGDPLELTVTFRSVAS
jgi:hypothetical protein